MSPKDEQKLFYRLAEVCRLAKIDAETIALWEKDFPSSNRERRLRAGRSTGRRTSRSSSGSRIFSGRNRLPLGPAPGAVSGPMDLPAGSGRPSNKIVELLWRVRDELQDLSQSLGRPAKNAAAD